MSQLHDPFDVLQPDHRDSNIIPFLPSSRVAEMVAVALSHPQVKPAPKPANDMWLWSSRALAAAACVILTFSFIAPVPSGKELFSPSGAVASLSPDGTVKKKTMYAESTDVEDLSDMLMMATLDTE